MRTLAVVAKNQRTLEGSNCEVSSPGSDKKEQYASARQLARLVVAVMPV
jgi:hypothetical protein